MFVDRLVRIVSNDDDYYRSLLWPIDLFDKVSDLKKDIQGFPFLVHHLNRLTIDLSKEEQVIKQRKIFFFLPDRHIFFFSLSLCPDNQ